MNLDRKRVKMLLVFCVIGFLSVACLDEARAEEITRIVEVSNEGSLNKADEPIVIRLLDLKVDFRIRSATVWDGAKEIPSQLDDLDGDRMVDELAFVLDVPCRSSKSLRIVLSSEKSDRKYPACVFAEMLVSDRNNKHVPVSSLTIPGTSNIYNQLHHHGPTFESELVAYRIYFDKKQTVDIYGKFHKGLEIEESQFYPTDEQLTRGFGDDVLMVGGSCGLGTLKGWDGKKAIHIDQVESLMETIRAYGPVRTVTDITAIGWLYQGAELQMTVRYILYAGHRDCEVQVRFSEPLKKELFSTGVLNIKKSDSFSDHKGLIACWGTDWPVSDTVKYAKETVGLAVCLPAELIKGESNDPVNYLYTIGAEGKSAFTYHITFTSLKETFGYKTKEEWFSFVQKWKNELQQPCRIHIR